MRYLAFLLLLCLVACNANQKESKTPNIILILADDLGYGDLHSYGSGYDDTPNLDRMAREGLVFTDFHSNGAVCSPTRAALLSGQYQQRVGVEAVVHATKFRHTGLNPGTLTLANFLNSLGYSTGIAGKWHLGYDTAFSPINYGFDQFRGFVSGNVDYHSHIDGAGYFDWWSQKDTITEEGYSTDLISSHALAFIRNNRDKPFFLYVAHEAPHFPYQGRGDAAIRTLGNGSLEKHAPEDRDRTYREMISAMDEGIGEILNTLEETGLLNNTLVFFMSDNGASQAGSNDPFRGYKSSLWEGGHRVPAIAFWPGTISAGRSDAFLLGMDIFPTVTSITGMDIPKDLALDGRDFSGILQGQKSMEDRAAYWRYNGQRAVRKGPWKLLALRDSMYLFNLAEDPAESINLIDSEKDLAERLTQMLKNWEADIDQHELNTY